MTDRELKRIREKVACPELGDKHYGEWGILRRNQRITICRLVEEVIRQREEIDRLYKQNSSIVEHLKKARKQLKTAKADAVKEFAERLKEKGARSLGDYFIVGWIDNLVKEMVGEIDG